MSVAPNLSQGTTLSISSDGGTTYVPVQLITDMTGPGSTSSALDVTTLADTAKKFIKGIVDNGSISATCKYDYDSAAETIVQANLAASGAAYLDFKLEMTSLSTPKKITGKCFFTKWGDFKHSVDNVREASFEMKISGSITIASIS